MTALPQPPSRVVMVPAVVRYPELTPDHRMILIALEASGGHGTAAQLSTTLQRPLPTLEGELQELQRLAFLEQTTVGWAIPTDLRARVHRDLNQLVGARLVTSTNERLRPTPMTVGERVLAQVCRTLCWPHPVATHVPLRRALDVQVMSSLLDEGDRAFLIHGSAHLDLLVEHHETGEALLALELDGPQHWESPQRERDQRKDRILRVAGLPLLRIWTQENDAPAPERLRSLLRWRLQAALNDTQLRSYLSPSLLSALDG